MTNSADNRRHERWDGDAAAYALDALDPTESRAFEEHLSACRRCQEELAKMRRAVEALPAAAPVRPAPPELKQRVMATVRAEETESAAAAPRPSWRRLSPPPGTWPRWALPGLAAAAAAVLAIALVAGGGSSARTYPGSVSAPGASASLHRSGTNAQLRVSMLPAPPPGRIYEVWLQRPGEVPAPARALFSTANGSVAVPGNLRGVQAVLVTAEPRPSGSSKPTRAPIIVVRLT